MIVLHSKQKVTHKKLKSKKNELDGKNKGILVEMRFDKNNDCLIGKITKAEKYFENNVLENQKHTKNQKK